MQILNIKESKVLKDTLDFIYAKWDFEKFNPVQSALLDYYDKDVNGIVAASTSAGKTVCAEIFLSYEIRNNGKKGIVLFPIKALAQEKYDDWTNPNHHFSDLRIKIITGDYRGSSKDNDDFDILIMTSEMLNSKSRHGKNNFIKDVGILVVDESHMISSKGRGDHLEVGLMNFVDNNPSARIILLSATMPNLDDVANWILKISNKDFFILNSKYRPCPLKIHYEEYDDSVNGYSQLEMEKINKALDIIEYYPKDKFLVFVHTKKSGEILKNELSKIGIEAEFHNANLEKNKRLDLEDKFKNNPDFKVIIATSTLACGMNLPSRRVIVLGVNRGLELVDSAEIMQMCGRAGRPKYDAKGDAYVLLPSSNFDSLKSKVSFLNKIQSQLLFSENNVYKVLSFHIVNEIYNKNIKTLEDIYSWYDKSFCSFQSQGIDEDILDTTIKNLKNKNIITEKNNEFYTTNVGKISSIFYYSPFDVADYKSNLKLYYNSEIYNDYMLSFILGNIDSNRCNIISKNEKEEISLYKQKISSILSQLKLKVFFNDSSLKFCFCYYNILSGLNNSNLYATTRVLQADFPRTLEVLKSINSFDLKFFDNDFFDNLRIRIQNGVPPHLVDLCKIKNIGKQRSQKLYDHKIKTIEDFINTPADNIKNIINLKQEIVEDLLKDAKNLFSKKVLVD